MQLANFTDYSLRVLIYLALKGKQLSTVGEIAERYQISRNHLVKVVHNLAKEGLIDSYKGKNGGIALSIAPELLNVGKMVRQLQSDPPLLSCFVDKEACVISPSCKLKGILKAAEKSFYETLNQYTLADLIKNQKDLGSLLFRESL